MLCFYLVSNFLPFFLFFLFWISFQKIILSIWHVRIFLNKIYLLVHLLFAELNGRMVRERLFPPIFKSISFKLLWHTFTNSQTNHWSGKFLLRWWSVMRIPIWFLLSILIIFDWENFRNYFSLENISKKCPLIANSMTFGKLHRKFRRWKEFELFHLVSY